MGAVRAMDKYAGAGSRALQASVRPTFRTLRLNYLLRKWLEIVAAKPCRAFGG